MRQEINVESLIQIIAATPDCRVYPASGLPNLEEGHLLPADLYEFYRLCGGLVMFETECWTFTILPPHEVLLANPIIRVGMTDEDVAASKAERDISWSWYT